MSRSNTPSYNIKRPPISGSANPSRFGTPLAARPAISLEEWESKTQLTDEQLSSISIAKERLAQRPLPEKFNKAETSAQGAANALNRPSTPKPRALANLIASPTRSPRSSAPNSPRPGSTSHLSAQNPLRPELITTPQQFQDHFAALTLSTEHEQDSLYREHLAEIVGLREKCDGLIVALKEGEGEVGEMLKALGYVEERSESLRGACEDLLEEQTHLLTHTSQLAHRLTFFTFLETAQRMLNNPSSSLVMSEEFLPMVKRLDECLGYLGEHRDFKDAELYLIRYQQCMTRSMTLIKIYFVNAVKQAGQEASKRLVDKSLSETASQGLLYTKFATLSQSIRPLIAELEQRVRSNPDELASLLGECHTAWVSTRQGLMGARVSQEVGRLDPVGSDLVDLTRAGCSYLKQTCMDEFNLFKHFFLSGESQLYGFLEGLCDYLYDHLRPRILHEPSLEVLCGVCTVLQALMVQDVLTLDHTDEIEDEVLLSPETELTPTDSPSHRPSYPFDDYFTQETASARQRRTGSIQGSIMTTRQHSYTRRDPTRRRRPLERLHTEILLRMVLQDAQTRLVFRAQALLRADVEYYVVKDGDLDYPERLKKGARSGKLVQRTMSISLDPEDDDEPAFLSLPPASVQEIWYPTLRVTLWVLSCLYTYVDSSVFDDLAQEAVSICRQSLSKASDMLVAKRAKEKGASPEDGLTDARLFLVRHLLILKEMTAGLDMGRRDRRRDWQGITDFLKSLLDNASAMLGYGRGSIVKASEFAPDAKIDVDKELKRACEDLIQQCTLTTTSSLRTFLSQCSSYLTSTTSTPSDLSSQAFATPEKVMQVHNDFKASVKPGVEAWVERLLLYLQDEETVRVLLPPAQNSIVDAYRQFHDLVRAEYDFSTAAGIMTPSALFGLLAGREEGTGGLKLIGAV